jgi:hypothetical protein
MMKPDEAERTVRQLIFKLSKGVICLRKLGAGVEGAEIENDEVNLTDKFVDYTVWNVRKLTLISLADVTSSSHSFGDSRWFDVGEYKVKIMRANAHLLPTSFIYALNEPYACDLDERFWWFVGRDIQGKRVSYDEGYSFCLQTNVNLWRRGLKVLVEELLKL